MDPAAKTAVAILRFLVRGGLAALALTPKALLDAVPVLCLYRRWTGRPCLGCGLTHSIWSLLHLHIAAGMHWNRLGIFVLPMLVGVALSGAPGKMALRERCRSLAIPAAQMRSACGWVWTVWSSGIAVLLLLTATVPKATAMRYAPVCQRKAQTGVECPLCGMTRDFLCIARGFDGPMRNRGSIPLYFGLLANEVVFVMVSARGRRQRGRKPRGSKLDHLGLQKTTKGEN